MWLRSRVGIGMMCGGRRRCISVRLVYAYEEVRFTTVEPCPGDARAGEGWACYAGTMINDCLADMKDTSNELIKSTATSANGILFLNI